MINKKYKDYFKGKKITVMGLGLLGRGVGDTAFLAECGADLIVTDLKNAEQLAPSLKKLAKFKKIKFVLGEHRLEDFKGRDLILKAAGVPLDSPYIALARRNNIPVEMSASLFAKLSGIKIIGVTGTRGKSTVTHLLEHILKTAKINFLLGGNVKGLSTLSLLKKVNKKVEWALFELDSWQLQGFGDAHMSPHISVFTSFYPDHQNYYKDSMSAYFSDKANIFKFQNEKDILVAGKQAMPFIKEWGGEIKSKVFTPSQRLEKGLKINLQGAHNEYNAMLAVVVARKMGITESAIKNALKTFKGVEGRLQLLRIVSGIKIYNDTTSTTPIAAIAALKALRSTTASKNIVLIMGGSDKNLGFAELLKEIKKSCKAVVLLSGSGTERVKAEWGKVKVPALEFSNLKDAVGEAMDIAKKGDVVLFSPGFTSFGMFKNEFDRGLQFVKLISKI